MPRPAKAPSDKKAITIKVRVTEDQQRRLRVAADRVGLELSTWIRLTALEHAAGQCFGVVALPRPEGRRRRE